MTRANRLGSQPMSATLQAPHKPASGAQPALVKCAAATKDVPSARSLASGKPPISTRPKLTNRPPLPPPTVHASEASAARARRPSLDEGAAAIVAPSARAPTIHQQRADALPTAVMSFVAEAGALVEGR
jgi:hypothetical protein